MVSRVRMYRPLFFSVLPACVFACLPPQTADLKLKSIGGGKAVGSGEDIDYKIRNVEHKVKNRDMVMDAIENRLARLEAQAKKD